MDLKELIGALRVSKESAVMTGHGTWAMLMHNAADALETMKQDIEHAVAYADFWEHMASEVKDLLAKTTEKVPKWIPVTERLPEPETEVLAAFDDGYVWAMWQKWSLTDEYEEGESPFDYYKDVGAGIHTVTHWMPLPEPPKEVNT